jgi:hypothetical protein
MGLACPGLENLNATVTQRFSTSNDAEPAPDANSYLFLTDEGVRYDLINGEAVEGPFNPNYNTLAVYNQSGLTEEQAAQAATRCDATVDWDNTNNDTLQPAMVYQH